MKFIVSSANLLKELVTIAGVLNSSNTLPILDDFLFEIKGNNLKISASDLETTISTTIALDKSEKDGNVAIPAKLLIDTLKTFPDQPLNFTIDSKTFGIELASDNGKYKLIGHNAEEFPKVPKIESPSTLEVEASLLYTAIDKTLFATGSDELRPVMSGVLFQFSEDGLTFVATDAHKLVKYERLDVKSESNASHILPKKPLNLLKSVIGNTSEKVKIEYSKANAMFLVGNITIICRLIEGRYPNYDAVIPKENPNVLTIDRLALLNSIKRVSIFSNKTTHQVRLGIKGSELNISAEDLDFSNEAKERLTCQYVGEDIEIGFNSRFVVEMLSNLNTDEVTLEMSAPNRAGILLPAASENKDEKVLMLVMPVILNN